MRQTLRTTVVLSFLLLTGCVAGNRHTFNYVPGERSDMGKGRLVLLFAVDDQRPYVVSGDEKPDFVGEQRNGYGMPFNVTTSDRRAFADVVRETIQHDLESAGFEIQRAEKNGDIAASLKAADATRGLAVVMREFKSDTYTNINFDYDFEAVAYDADGREIARNRVAGEDVLPGSFMNPPRAAKEKVPSAFYAKMRELVVGDTEMMKALTSDR